MRSVCDFSSLHPTHLSPNLQQTSTILSCPAVLLPAPVAPIQTPRRGTGTALLSVFPHSSLPIPSHSHLLRQERERKEKRVALGYLAELQPVLWWRQR